MKRFKSFKPFKFQLFKLFKRKEKKLYRRKVLKNFQFKDVGRANKSIFEKIQYIKKEQDNLSECIDVQFVEVPKEPEEK